MLPLTNVELMVLLAVEPATIETLPEFVTVKSKLLVLENQALASELAFELFLKALALSSVSVETTMGAEYLVDDWVGDEPSAV